MEKYKVKKYTHFDNRISIDKVFKDISNPLWIKSHGFYPFIHYELKFLKYNKEERKVKEKIRQLFYASHVDSYIYKYYGDLLNERYNEMAIRLDIDEVATAYRNNRNGKCNIHYAKEVIDFIRNQDNAYILVADFSKYFDNINHSYLKCRIKDLLEVDRLTDDYFAVFKNITKYSWVEKTTIESILKKKYKTKDRIKKHTIFRFFDSEDFRKLRKSDENNIETNPDPYGIPQGAAISSVFSNIFLMEFDRLINEYVKSLGGIYRRYCDDLIIVIPNNCEGDYDFDECVDFLINVKNQVPNLVINKEKTEKLIYKGGSILDSSDQPSFLDYLGFTFDGSNVRIREKSLFKFYSRAYKKVKLCNQASKEYGIKKYRRDLYTKYTHLGKYKGNYGNFLTYVSRAQKIFDKDTTTNNLMEDQVKNHWKYIQKRLEPIK